MLPTPQQRHDDDKTSRQAARNGDWPISGPVGTNEPRPEDGNAAQDTERPHENISEITHARPVRSATQAPMPTSLAISMP